MFSARYLFKKAKKALVARHPNWTQTGVIVHAVGILLLFSMLWGISAMGTLRIFLPNVLQLTGWPGTERHYLVLFQNNAELRATGGFITAFAQIDLKNGLPASISFQDVYGEIDDHDYISPPYPMDILLEANSSTYAGHSFRDANYNPDFPSTVEEILSFFELTNPDTKIDGVVAMNFSVLEDIVGLYEPVRVDGYTLTEANLFETLEAKVSDIDRHNLEELSTRKDIIKTFAYDVIKKMVFIPWKYRELSEVIIENLNQKELLLFFNNNALSKKIDHMGWDGSFPSAEEDPTLDRFAVNISNFGGMKTDRYITREVHYTIEVTEEFDEAGLPIIYGDVEVNLRHRGDYNTPLSGEYKGYLRVFVPEGAELVLSSTGESREETIEDHVAWGDTILLQPGEEATYSYRIKLNPDYFMEEDYQLYVVKQSGTENDYYEVVVRAPKGENIESNDFSVKENVAFYQKTLTQDVKLDLTFLSDDSSPRIFYHELTGLNVIDIGFNESLNEASTTDPLYYEIIDLDVNVPEITDIITIDFITEENGHVRIYTRGMDLQFEEHFQVLMRNIRDEHGNFITPNPRTITVVQRLDE